MKNMYKSFFKVLWNLVDQESDGTREGICSTGSKHEPFMTCTRVKDHTGMHIATASDSMEVYEIWDNFETTEDKNQAVGLAMELLHKIVNISSKKNCGGRYCSVGCCRTSGHKGPHVAIGSRVIAVWDPVVESAGYRGD